MTCFWLTEWRGNNITTVLRLGLKTVQAKNNRHKQSMAKRRRLGVPEEGREWEGWAFGGSGGCKLLYLEQMGTGILLCSTWK